MSHTQGKLVASDPSDALHPIRKATSGIWPLGRVIADVGYADTEEENTANARRLVACWNAADGIPTEELEAAADGRLLNIFEGLIRERDELMKALAKCVETLSDTRIGQWSYMEGSQIYEDFGDAVQSGRAAIARVKGGV